MSVWDRYGLGPPGLFFGRAKDPRLSLLPRATRFRMALEDQGGLFVLFGRFLAGRADLLPSPHLRELRAIKPHRSAAELPPLGQGLAGKVEGGRALRAAAGRAIYEATYQGQAIVVEVYADEAGAFDDKALTALRRGLEPLKGGLEAPVVQPRTLEHFREWLQLAGDIERRRTILRNLGDLPSGCVLRFPRLISELQSSSCLAYEGGEGIPLEQALQPGSPDRAQALSRLVEGLLELSLLLSLVDGESMLENYASLPDGHVGFRSLPLWAPIPVEWHYELLQYMASTVAGQSPRALHMLSRIASSKDPYASEQRLIRELSGLQPELKINVVTSESVTNLENYWRALKNTHMQPPLFLELFHRQWTVAGQYNGEISPASDMIAEGMGPVLTRILRYRFSEMMSLDKAKEWVAGSGMMLFAGVRQMAMLIDQIRENDIAMVVDRQEYESREAKLNSRILALVRSALALAVFLAAAYMAYHAGAGAVRVAAGAAAAISGIFLVLSASRIE